MLPPVVGLLSRSGIAITDPGADTWTGTVNYGDGTGDQTLALDQANKTFDLLHTYTVDGAFTVTVTLSDDDGAFTYDPSGAFESLAAGEIASVSFDYQIEDSFGETASATVTIMINGENDAPLLVNAGDVAVSEGETASNTGAWSDADANDILTLSATLGSVARHADGTWTWTFDTTDGPDNSQLVVITADDGNGGSAQTSFRPH